MRKYLDKLDSRKNEIYKKQLNKQLSTYHLYTPKVYRYYDSGTKVRVEKIAPFGEYEIRGDKQVSVSASNGSDTWLVGKQVSLGVIFDLITYVFEKTNSEADILELQELLLLQMKPFVDEFHEMVSGKMTVDDVFKGEHNAEFNALMIKFREAFPYCLSSAYMVDSGYAWEHFLIGDDDLTEYHPKFIRS